MTVTQATIDGLKARGFTQDMTARYSTYLVFRKPNLERKYLVGRSGALRVVSAGQTIASSLSLTGSKSHLAFQAVGRSAGCLTSVAQADALFTEKLGWMS